MTNFKSGIRIEGLETGQVFTLEKSYRFRKTLLGYWSIFKEGVRINGRFTCRHGSHKHASQNYSNIFKYFYWLRQLVGFSYGKKRFVKIVTIFVTVLLKMTLCLCICFVFTKNPLYFKPFKIDTLNFTMYILMILTCPFKTYVVRLHNLKSMNIFSTIDPKRAQVYFGLLLKSGPGPWTLNNLDPE